MAEFRFVFCWGSELRMPQRSPGKRVCTLFRRQGWHDSALETKRVQGACAWAWQTMPFDRVPVGVQGEERESPAPGSHSSRRKARNTLRSLLPSSCCSLGWGWHRRWPEPPSRSSILPFLLHVRAKEKAGWQGCFSELLLNAPAAPCASTTWLAGFDCWGGLQGAFVLLLVGGSCCLVKVSPS